MCARTRTCAELTSLSRSSAEIAEQPIEAPGHLLLTPAGLQGAAENWQGAGFLSCLLPGLPQTSLALPLFAGLAPCLASKHLRETTGHLWPRLVLTEPGKFSGTLHSTQENNVMAGSTTLLLPTLPMSVTLSNILTRTTYRLRLVTLWHNHDYAYH